LAGFSSSIFQILSSLVGSGLTLFVITNSVSDFNQPHINLQVDQSIIRDNQIKSQILVSNDGRVAATHVLLTAFYPAANILNYSSPFHSEDMTLIQQKPTLLVANINRLAKDATIAVNIMLVMNKHLGFNNNSYIVSASYDQGSTTISNINSPLLNVNNPTLVPNRIRLLVFASTLSAIFFILALSYKRIKNFTKSLGRPTYILSVIREMASIQNELKNDIISKRIFTSEIWESKDDQIRRQIFSNYEDYNKVDEFYVELKKRDSILSQKNISNDLVKKYNRSCLWLAIYVLRNIDWTRYLDIGHKRTRLALTISVAILSSFLIFIVFEVFRIYLFFHIPGINEQYSSITYDVFSLIARSVVAFFLAREIINFYWKYNYEFDTEKNNIVFNIALHEYGLIKLFVFSLLIMGVPLFSIIRESHFLEERSNFAYEYFTFLLISDIARMLILILIIPRFLIKGHLIKIKEIVQYDLGESNFGKATYNEQHEEKQQQQRQPYLQQQQPQRDYSYNYDEELSKLKRVDDDNDDDGNDNKNKSQEIQTFKLVDTLNELERLADLRKNGIITEEEFQMLKAELFRKL
jgi:Short C-terminal domain